MEERPDFDQKHGILVDEELEQEFEVEIAEKEPSFLLNQTTKSGAQLSPIRLMVEPNGSLARSANNAATQVVVVELPFFFFGSFFIDLVVATKFQQVCEQHRDLFTTLQNYIILEFMKLI